MIRAVIARKRFRRLREKREAGMARGVAAPLQGKLRLTLKKGDGSGKADIVLSLTTGARKEKAAVRIQARMRGYLARKR